MKKRIIQYLSIILILCFFSTNATYGWEIADANSKLPAGIPYKNKNNYRLNLTLFLERGLQVYGTPEEMANNDFKLGSNTTLANDNSGYDPNAGHFTNSKGQLGEWRYYGYDLSGETFTNPYFPVDEEMKNPVSSYKYIYRIWEETNPYYMYHPQYAVKDIGHWNKIAIDFQNSSIKGTMQAQINAMQTFNITNTVNAVGGSTKFYDYAHIKSMPTYHTTGEVRLFHLATFKNGTKKVYYVDETVPIQTTPPPQLEEAKLTAIFDEDTLNSNIEALKEKDAIKISVTLNGIFDDTIMYDGKVNANGLTDIEMRQLMYDRSDIAYWNYYIQDDNTNTKQKFKLQDLNINTKYNFNISIPYDKYKDKVDAISRKVEVSLKGWAEVVFKDGNTMIASDTIGDEFPTIEKPIPDKVTPPTDVPEWEKPRYPIKVDIQAPYYMLDTERFKLQDNTDHANVEVKIVTLDGKILDGDEKQEFLSGDYLFSLVGKDRIYNYEITYINQDGWIYSYKSYVKVFTTKPHTQIRLNGKQKESRTLTATNDTDSVNSSYLLERSTMTPINYNVLGEKIYIGTQNNNTIQFISKHPFSDIDIKLQVKCNVNPTYVERTDIPEGYHISNDYTYKLQVVPDYAPAVSCNIWNFVMTRNETLNMYYDAVSTDGDRVVTDTYKLYYDANEDGVYETLLQSGKTSDFKNFKPDKLGNYKLTFDVAEEFGAGEPTLSQFITAEDIKKTTLEREFFVANLAPQTQIYIDIPVNYPMVDIIWLNDETIARTTNDSIVSNRVDFTNNLLRESLNPNVQVWDLHTYIYEQSASTSKNTEGDYPPATIPYTSNGYSGTLTSYNVINNPYEKDCGGYIYVTRTKTATASGTGWSKAVYKKGVCVSSSSSNNSTKSYNSGGYSGTLYQDDFWETGTSGSLDKDGNGTITTHYAASYSGTVSGTFKEWQSDWQSFNDYTGYYSGTIYKPVKAEFEPVYRDNSNKYLVYYADTNINNIADIQKILNRAASKVIVIGNNTVKNDSRVKKDLFIPNTKSLNDIYAEIIKYIAKDNPQERGAVVLLNQEFNIEYADVDLDKDPIQADGFQVVHNPSYFDNSLGQATNTRTEFSQTGYTLTSLPVKFNKTGQFDLYRKIKDIPADRPDDSEISNNAKISIFVHRKPIASCTLDWAFNNSTGIYKTTWVDTSYDPDLQYKDPEGKKGIRDRKIKYRKIGATDWIYEIPDNLMPAKYELEYIVKDNFGIWSDPFKMTFELPDIPPAQINAKLRTELSSFNLSSVPASENLIAYDIWTRYPFDLKLQLALYNGVTQVSPTKEVTYSTNTGKKVEQDIFWNDILYNIPATLSSQLYIMKIRALDIVESTRYTDINFNVTVKTPINLVPKISEKIIAAKDFVIEATTSKYVNSAYSGSGVKVTLFDGTSYARTLTLTGTRSNWSIITNQPVSIPEGIYTARFVATLPSGETEIKTVQYKYVHNTPPVINDGKIFAELNMNYIYENDDVNYTLRFHDVDLTPLDIDVKLFKSTNTITPIKEYNKTVIPNGTAYDPYTLRLIDDIPLGDYVLKVTVTDDYDETATLTTNFTAHDLWVKGAVAHTDDWEKNRQTYNTKYPSKARTIDTYWNGESFETSANTTVINMASLVKCNKVSVEVINKDKPSDNRYLQWLNSDNITDDKWKLSYWDKEWVSKGGDVTVKWGADKKQELTLRFTAYFNNDWVETVDIKVYIDNLDDYWKLHRAW